MHWLMSVLPVVSAFEKYIVLNEIVSMVIVLKRMTFAPRGWIAGGRHDGGRDLPLALVRGLGVAAGGNGGPATVGPGDPVAVGGWAISPAMGKDFSASTD